MNPNPNARYNWSVSEKSLLSAVPKPLLEELIAGRWLPIIGAGMSMNAEMPGSSERLPNWEELGEQVSADLPAGYSSGSPIESLSAFEHHYGRPRLIERVNLALKVGKARPGEVHRQFCAIPFENLVTTNVEQLLEVEYASRYGAVLAVIEEQQLRLANPYGAPLLVKLHGDLHHPSSLVLTEGDYDAVANEKPLFMTWLANQLITRTGIMIGYSLEDADFRQVLTNLKSRLGGSPPDLYVIEVGADPVRVQRYLRRGVRVINLPKTRQGYGILADFFKQLHEYWTDHFSSHLTGTTASVRAILRAGSRVENAVLFLVDDRQLSLYDEFVFPAVSAAGFVPLTPEDVTHPNGYRVATLEALTRVSGLAVADGSAVAKMSGSKLANTLGPQRLVRVGTLDDAWPEGGAVTAPTSIEEWPLYASRITEQLSQVRSSLRDFGAYELGPAYEVERLRESGDLRAAALIGFIEIERGLNEQLKPMMGESWQKSRSVGLQQLISVAPFLQLEAEGIDPQKIIQTRNQMVHGQESLSKPELVRLVKNLERILEKIDETEFPAP